MLCNQVHVEHISGRSRITHLVQRKPLKILTPRSEAATAAQIILSNYGAGFVAGDQAELHIACQEKSSLFLGSQANSRIYKNDGTEPATFHSRIELHKGSTLVQLNDPIVLHRDSWFEQHQNWIAYHHDVHVLNIEYLSVGRKNFSEEFCFKKYRNHFCFTIGARPYYIDRFTCEPSRFDYRTTSRFGEFNYLLNIFAYGKFANSLKNLPTPRGYTNNQSGPARSISINSVKSNGVCLRALGISRADLDPVIRTLFEHLEEQELFYNPLKRKF